MANKPVAVIAGLGSGSGTGVAVALHHCPHRSQCRLSQDSDEINAAGGTAAPFPISSCSTMDINAAYARIRAHYQGQPIRVALYNTTHDVWKPFLDIISEDVQGVTQMNLEGAFAFSKNVIQAFQANQVDKKGKQGSLIFTGATASSLAKEFGKQNIHVSHAIIDGGILTNSSHEHCNDREWEQNEDVRLSPDGIAEEITPTFVLGRVAAGQARPDDSLRSGGHSGDQGGFYSGDSTKEEYRVSSRDQNVDEESVAGSSGEQSQLGTDLV
ncbi:uncharacterized protein ARMOST_19439 [Armillaria ostoyae]|uniref:Uncharacterized protein n=1 Tax=Armillaria ostoyae TaxID=47428 RepID=A0A284S4J6_ARMOS|nr:uncharacterized protein ARMOST_19439 [Armillaria ostoyae]